MSSGSAPITSRRLRVNISFMFSGSRDMVRRLVRCYFRPEVSSHSRPFVLVELWSIRFWCHRETDRLTFDYFATACHSLPLLGTGPIPSRLPLINSHP